MRRLVTLLPLLLGCGCDFIERWVSRPVELKESAPVEGDREERILRSSFNTDFAQRKIAHLELSDLADFDSVSQRLDEIRSSYGEPDEVAEADLTPFGIAQRVRVHRYGRLGLATPLNGDDPEVFWVLISSSED